jgi:catechol 1,2-dioxygenase
MGPATTPRMRVVMGLLIQHLHDFAREAELTVDEWMAGVEMINWAGKMSDDKRNEGQLMCDVIGVESCVCFYPPQPATMLMIRPSLVDEITYKLAQEADNPATASAILGPFWRHDTPHYPNGTSIVENCPDGEITYMHGKVIDAETKKPLPGVNVDVWQASTNGLYEQQDPDQREHNLRGVFETDSNGEYGFYCIRPTPYPVPGDGRCIGAGSIGYLLTIFNLGPAGKLLKLMDRHPMRPAHIHIIVR